MVHWLILTDVDSYLVELFLMHVDCFPGFLIRFDPFTIIIELFDHQNQVFNVSTFFLSNLEDHLSLSLHEDVLSKIDFTKWNDLSAFHNFSYFPTSHKPFNFIKYSTSKLHLRKYFDSSLMTSPNLLNE